MWQPRLDIGPLVTWQLACLGLLLDIDAHYEKPLMRHAAVLEFRNRA